MVEVSWLVGSLRKQIIYIAFNRKNKLIYPYQTIGHYTYTKTYNKYNFTVKKNDYKN